MPEQGDLPVPNQPPGKRKGWNPIKNWLSTRRGEVPSDPALEAQYSTLKTALADCDRLIPKQGLEIWDGGLHGTRMRKQKEFTPKGAVERVRRSLGARFTNPVEQTQILESTNNFLSLLASNVDPKDYDTVPLGQLDRFLAGYPNNMLSRLGENASAETMAEIVRIGTHTVEHHVEEKSKYPDGWPMFHPNGALGTAALLVGEAIPAAVANSKTNQRTILANFGQAAQSLSSYRLVDTIESYERFTAGSQKLSSPEEIQASMLQMESVIRDIDPEIVEHQFKQDQVQAIMDTVEAVTKALPDTTPQEVLTVINGAVTDRLKTVHESDRIAGHLFIGQGVKVVTRGVRTAIERGDFTMDKFIEVVNQQTEVTGEVVRQLNAGRTGRNDRETDDWRSIDMVLDRNVVQRIIDVSEATHGQLTTQEIITWIKGSRTPIWDETWRLEGMLVTAELVAKQAQNHGLSQESAGLVAQTIRPLDQLPGVAFNRGSLRVREFLLREGLKLPANELSGSLLAVHRSYADLLSDREAVDHQPIRAPESETRAIQLERGFEFASGVDLLRERILRAFLTDTNRATQITRGCALMEDVYRTNIFDERPFERVQEIFASFRDPVNIDTFLNGLGRLTDIYDEQGNIGQRQLVKDALAFVLNTDDPTETLIRLFEGNANSVRSAAWFGRLVGENKTNLSLLDSESAIAMLTTSNQNEGASLPSQSTELVHQATTTDLVSRVIDSSVSLGKALQAYMVAHGGGEEGLQAVKEKIGSLELSTAEDAQAFLPAIASAMSKFFHVSPAELQAHMVSVQPISGVINEAAKRNPIAGAILRISSVLGGGEVPHMAYAPGTNAIFINEKNPKNYSVDELGEEVAHWARELARPNEEDSDPAVHEFFGFLGRRIVRKALGLPDVTTKPEDLAEGIKGYQESILDAERFPSMIDTGFEARLRSTYAHLMGYVAASNIPLDEISDDLIRIGEQEVKNTYLNQYGLQEDWFRKEEQRIREFFRQQTRRASFGEPVSEAALNKMLNALRDAQSGPR